MGHNDPSVVGSFPRTQPPIRRSRTVAEAARQRPHSGPGRGDGRTRLVTGVAGDQIHR